MNEYPTEEQKLLKIKNGDRLYLKTVYEAYREAFIAFLLKYFKCSKEDALTVYQEAFTIFYFNIKDEKLTPPLKSTLKTYLLGIGRLVYHKKFLGTYQKRMEFPQKLNLGFQEAEVLKQYDLKSQQQLIKTVLSKLKASCQELIRLFYFKNYDAQEVAEEMGFNSTGAARKHKYDCLKKMRSLLNKEK